MAKMAAGTGRVFDEIPGYPVGNTFVDRVELARSGVHPPRMKGISGSQDEGADSIVVSGGYEDDHDLGGVIVRHRAHATPLDRHPHTFTLGDDVKIDDDQDRRPHPTDKRRRDRHAGAVAAESSARQPYFTRCALTLLSGRGP